MSLIVITTPWDGMPPEMCATCLQIQLTWFRNEIKEQWNRYNNDGKPMSNRINIPLRLNPDYIMEMGATIVNGSLVCVTHMFNALNNAAEMEAEMKGQKIVPASRVELPNAFRKI